VGRSQARRDASADRRKRKEQEMGLKVGKFAGVLIIRLLPILRVLPVLALSVPVAGVLVASAPSLAQQQSPPTVSAEGAPIGDLPLADYQAFDSFGVAHPEIVSALSHNPKLIEDDNYLSKHPELGDFLASHSELRSAFIEDPGDFLAPNSRRKPK
jgi:hypothetical protein